MLPITSQVVKILEKIIASHIHGLLSKNKFINCDQHVFQESASCVTQLLECPRCMIENLQLTLST